MLAETQKGEEQQAGSTATVVLARRDKLVVANVGDSRAVLCRNGQPQDLSTEHRRPAYQTTVAHQFHPYRQVVKPAERVAGLSR